ncbi:unnamed protein product [Mytilus coruscus]|uniref:Uncharacterized protein n=1 Tax=Mytilus coruscus TaxID=42192 RepID=A0A6J8C8L8_MYTCO|nr:unnamed protein product [Mytilus coruscus]
MFCDVAILNRNSATRCWTVHYTLYSVIAGDHHPKLSGAAVLNRDCHPITNCWTANNPVSSASTGANKPKVLHIEAQSSPPPNVEGYEPERPWMDGEKRQVEFREENPFYPPRRIQLTSTGVTKLPTVPVMLPPPKNKFSYMSGKDAAKVGAKVVPDGYLVLLVEEKVVLLDGTVYLLKSTWIPDPSMTRQKTRQARHRD